MLAGCVCLCVRVCLWGGTACVGGCKVIAMALVMGLLMAGVLRGAVWPAGV